MTTKTILLVEDDPSDINLMKLALRKRQTEFNIETLTMGSQVLPYLMKQGVYEKTPHPDLILLDLNIPGTSGKEVLNLLKGHPFLRMIPIVIFSSSDYERDITDCYMAHANCYVKKPQRLEDLAEVMNSVVNFWLFRALRPTNIPIKTAS